MRDHARRVFAFAGVAGPGRARRRSPRRRRETGSFRRAQ